MNPQHEYLGDGVYASFDGYHIWLRTGSHDSEENKIALDPAVFAALQHYAERVNKAAQQPPPSSVPGDTWECPWCNQKNPNDSKECSRCKAVVEESELEP